MPQERQNAPACDNSTMTFPAIRGTQAGKSYYVVQMPYPDLLKLFKCNEENVLPGATQARQILAEIVGNYIVENIDNYVLPAIEAWTSTEMTFEAIEIPGTADQIGLLHAPLDAILVHNHEQYRLLGIKQALQQFPALRNETIAVTIFYSQGLQP